MPESKKCPKCRRICLASEKECICGYNFELGETTEEAKQLSHFKKAYIIATIAVVLVSAVVAAVLDLGNPIILVLAALATEGAVFGLIYKKRGGEK